MKDLRDAPKGLTRCLARKRKRPYASVRQATTAGIAPACRTPIAPHRSGFARAVIAIRSAGPAAHAVRIDPAAWG